MSWENPLRSLKINNYYSYLLAIGGFLLIISILYEPKIISQSKLILLCLITILYGVIEWIREKHFKEKSRQLNGDWLIFWDEQPMKGLAELNNPHYDANLRKKFMKDHKAENLIPKYHIKTWIILIIYLALMIFVYLS